MKLYMKQKVFSWTDQFSIYDEQMNEKYYAHAAFGFLHHVEVEKNNQVIGHVEQQLRLFLPEFIFYLHGKVLGSITREFRFFANDYSLDFNGWYVEGDWLGMDYRLFDRNGRTVMVFTKEWLTWGDTYVLDIRQEEYEDICVMIAIAIDCAICSQND